MTLLFLTLILFVSNECCLIFEIFQTFYDYLRPQKLKIYQAIELKIIFEAHEFCI